MYILIASIKLKKNITSNCERMSCEIYESAPGCIGKYVLIERTSLVN